MTFPGTTFTVNLDAILAYFTITKESPPPGSVDVIDFSATPTPPPQTHPGVGDAIFNAKSAAAGAAAATLVNRHRVGVDFTREHALFPSGCRCDLESY